MSYDIHKDEPDWKFYSLVSWLALIGTTLVGPPWQWVSTPNEIVRMVIFVVMLPLWCIGLAGGFHLFLSLPLLRKVMPEKPSTDLRAWIISYEDASVEPEVFAGNGAEEAARARFEEAKQHWTCHLFKEET